MRIGRLLLSLAPALLWLSGCPTDEEPDLPATVQISDVQAVLHDTIESIVVVSWNQDVAGDTWVEFLVEGEEDWRRTPTLVDAVEAQQQLLLGVPYGSSVTYRVVNDFGEGPLLGDEAPVATGAVPLPILQPELLSTDPGRWEPTGRYLIGSIHATEPGWTGGEYWLFVLDRQGRLVWTLRTDDKHFCLYVRVSADGDDLLWDEATFWTDWDGGAGSLVHRMKIDGTILDSRPAPGLHHAFTELSDGTLVWPATNGKQGTLEQLSPDGTRSTLWVCDAYFGDLGLEPHCLVNSVSWREETDSLLLSFPEYDTVLDLDRASGEVLRSFGAAPGSWAIDPPDAMFDLQHGVTYTDAGTLLLSTHVSPDDLTGVAREFELDEDDQTLRQIWSYGADQGVEAWLGGEAHRLPGGNTLHNYGTTPRIKEITPGGDVVWDVTFSEQRLLGRTIWVEDLYVFGP